MQKHLLPKAIGTMLWIYTIKTSAEKIKHLEIVKDEKIHEECFTGATKRIRQDELHN